MERAAVARDAAYDGTFFFAVRTTRIFCRPSCPARKPRAENMAFFMTAREALGAGFRPCLRCRPLDTDGEPPDWVDELLELVTRSPETRLRDADLKRRGIDPARARRTFQRHFGLTFQAYCRRRRIGAALAELRAGATLDEVALGSGFESHSGFRDAYKKVHGRPPGASRDASCIWTATIESPLGPLVAGATPRGICLLEFSEPRRLETQLAALKQVFRCAIVPGTNPHLELLREELGDYFAGGRTAFTVPTESPGTDFQQRVWSRLRAIPYGEVRSYVELARDLGQPGAARAVGRANGQNRLAILIPCHRVVNRNGELGGYGGGVWRKRRLLDLEQQTIQAKPSSRAAIAGHPQARTAEPKDRRTRAAR
jgi:AraC family transcriptional regulator of adaptative response/methylated-DNA-[protein]-cysteine methyltransferase